MDANGPLGSNKLSVGDSILVKVKATNSVGDSPESAEGGGVTIPTPSTVPSAPGTPTILI